MLIFNFVYSLCIIANSYVIYAYGLRGCVPRYAGNYLTSFMHRLRPLIIDDSEIFTYSFIKTYPIDINIHGLYRKLETSRNKVFYFVRIINWLIFIYEYDMEFEHIYYVINMYIIIPQSFMMIPYTNC